MIVFSFNTYLHLQRVVVKNMTAGFVAQCEGPNQGIGGRGGIMLRYRTN
jgi:hypothetical protein